MEQALASAKCNATENSHGSGRRPNQPATDLVASRDRRWENMESAARTCVESAMRFYQMTVVSRLVQVTFFQDLLEPFCNFARIRRIPLACGRGEEASECSHQPTGSSHQPPPCSPALRPVPCLMMRSTWTDPAPPNQPRSSALSGINYTVSVVYHASHEGSTPFLRRQLALVIRVDSW